MESREPNLHSQHPSSLGGTAHIHLDGTYGLNLRARDNSGGGLRVYSEIPHSVPVKNALIRHSNVFKFQTKQTSRNSSKCKKLRRAKEKENIILSISKPKYNNQLLQKCLFTGLSFVLSRVAASPSSCPQGGSAQGKPWMKKVFWFRINFQHNTDVSNNNLFLHKFPPH